MDGRGAVWFETATTRWQDWDAADLAARAASGGRRISVVLPARDEQATIGPIVEGIRRDLIERVPLVDELVVIDSDSSDDTARVATEAGATVHAAAAVRPDLGSRRGKGEAIWKSLFVTSGELLVFVDADLTGWGTHFVTGLLGPLLTDPGVQHVKGFYDRAFEGQNLEGQNLEGESFDDDDGTSAHGPQGGRVTELVARPLINLYRPELAAVVQPLAGEWAIRRAALESLSLPIGYGVEIAVLLDVAATWGPDAVAQVDLGARAHVHQTVHDLGVMAAEIIDTFVRRTGGRPVEPTSTLWQYVRADDPPWRGRDVPLTERPPWVNVRGEVPAC